jgi:MFS family permease
MKKLKGVAPQKAALLISIMGIANTIGRVATGLIADLPSVNALFVNNLSLLLSGICILCVPFCNHYYEFVIVSVFFGLFISSFVSLSSIVLVELLGLNRLTSAFGLKLMFQGFAAIIGSPLAGIAFNI